MTLCIIKKLDNCKTFYYYRVMTSIDQLWRYLYGNGQGLNMAGSIFKCPKCGGALLSAGKYLQKGGMVLTRRRKCVLCGHRVTCKEFLLGDRNIRFHVDIDVAMKEIRMRLDNIDFERSKILETMENLKAVWNR